MPARRKRDIIKPKVEYFYEHCGNYITCARLDADMTQQALAEKVGLTRTSIANLEAGRQRFPAYTLWMIAEALEVSIAALCPPVKQKQQSGTKPRMIAYPSRT